MSILFPLALFLRQQLWPEIVGDPKNCHKRDSCGVIARKSSAPGRNRNTTRQSDYSKRSSFHRHPQNPGVLSKKGSRQISASVGHNLALSLEWKWNLRQVFILEIRFLMKSHSRRPLSERTRCIGRGWNPLPFKESKLFRMIRIRGKYLSLLSLTTGFSDIMNISFTLTCHHLLTTSVFINLSLFSDGNEVHPQNRI